MDRRLELHEKLCEILGSRNVYFQPPEQVKLEYPCIVYSKPDMFLRYAENYIYTGVDQYSITVIDKDPDSKIHKDILKSFQMCDFDRFYISDNLNHNTLTLYY